MFGSYTGIISPLEHYKFIPDLKVGTLRCLTATQYSPLQHYKFIPDIKVDTLRC